MTEVEYIESIDACFPYRDENVWKATIDQGISTSDNAAYMALHEICGAPPEIPQSDLQQMFEYWDSRYSHPTKPIVMNAAKVVLQNTYLPEAEVLRCLDEIAMYPSLYNAIGILWHAAPRGGDWPGRATEVVEQKCDEIRGRWEQRGPY